MTENIFNDMNYSDYKYQHVEHWDTDETEYLKEVPMLTVQPKLDGTNGVVICVFENSGIAVKAGSRTRFVTPENDNHGFAKFVKENKNLFKALAEEVSLAEEIKDACNCKTVIFYGEFLINNRFLVKPEFLRKFAIFDVCVDGVLKDPNAFGGFKVMLKGTNILTVPSITVNSKDINTLPESQKDFSLFLMRPEFKTGEGFVIKDYTGNKNRYGRTVWAKLVYGKPDCPKANMYDDIVNNWFSAEYLEKEYCKYLEKFPKERPVKIQKFANLVSREFIKEETTNIVFKFKFPEINFANLFGKLTKKALYFAKVKNADSAGANGSENADSEG